MKVVPSTVDLWTAGCAGSRLSARCALAYGQAMDNALRCPALAHRSAAAHKLHSAQATIFLQIRETKNQTPGTSFSLFHPGGCPSYRDHPTPPPITCARKIMIGRSVSSLGVAKISCPPPLGHHQVRRDRPRCASLLLLASWQGTQRPCTLLSSSKPPSANDLM